MSDKVPVQQQLAAALADLMLAPLPFDRALLLLSTCLTTLQREWTSIDQLRMDKFMTLVRRFVHRGFSVLAAGGWNMEQVEAVTTLYLEPEGRAPLSADTVARGFFLHITDTFLPELEGAAAESPKNTPMTFEALNTLLTPFYHVLALTKDQSMVERVRKEVFDPIVELCRPMKQTAAAPAAANGKRKQQTQQKQKQQKDSDDEAEDMSDEDDEEDEEEEQPQQEEEDAGLAAQFPLLHSVLQGHAPSLASILFQLASDADITEKSRKLLYQYSAQLQQAAQQGEEDEDQEAEAEADAAAAAVIAAQKKTAAKAARKAAATSTATAAAALTGKKRKSAADDDEADAEEGEAVLEPGVGSEGLAKVSAALSKKKNKKQRLAAKRRKTEALLGTEAGAVDGKHAAAAAAAAASKQSKKQRQNGSVSAPDSDDDDDGEDGEEDDNGAFDYEDEDGEMHEMDMEDLDSDEERELEDEEQASASASFDDEAEEDDSASLALHMQPQSKMSKKELARLEAALAAAQAKKKSKQPKKIQPTLVRDPEAEIEMDDEQPQKTKQSKQESQQTKQSKKTQQHQPQAPAQQQQPQPVKSKKPAATPAAPASVSAATAAAAAAAAAATSSAVAAAAAFLTTPPKSSSKQRAGPTIIPDPSLPASAAAPAAFLTPQPTKKPGSPSKQAHAGTALKSSLASSAAAPPSSSKKNVSIVLANNDVRLFKRFSRDSMSVSTSELLAKPSPKSAIKPQSIEYFLAHNKNGRELAAARRQQALASEMNAAAPQSGSGRTPPVSPSRAKAADFFFQ